MTTLPEAAISSRSYWWGKGHARIGKYGHPGDYLVVTCTTCRQEIACLGPVEFYRSGLDVHDQAAGYGYDHYAAHHPKRLVTG